MGRHKANDSDDGLIANQEPLQSSRRVTTTQRIYDDTFDIITNAIENGLVKDQNGNEVKKLADIIEIAVAKLLNIRMVNNSERQYMRDYDFTDISQLDEYFRLIELIPKESRWPVTMKGLRHAIINNYTSEFMSNGYIKRHEPEQDIVAMPEDF